MNYNPAYPFYRHSTSTPDSPALWVDGTTFSYCELAEQACRVSAWLRQVSDSRVKRVAILAHRQIAVYRGILGICWSGACYVPLNPAFPDQRLEKIMSLANPDALIVDKQMLARLTPDTCRKFAGRILIADGATDSVYGQAIDGFDLLPESEMFKEPVFVDADSEAYLVFTSGSTGTPNGVVVRAGNLDYSIRAISKRYPFTDRDRFSQFFDLSFDFSVMDLFVPWLAGACTYVVPDAQKVAPGRFIVDHGLTVWTCVPSLIALMARMKLLRPGCFPSLRYSFFSGEMLTEEAAGLWDLAASNGTLVNLYGQCETIIASLAHNYDSNAAVVDITRSVPLGTRLEGIVVAVVANDGTFVEPGATGELAISGPHVVSGYLDNPQRTAEKFRDFEHSRYGLRSWYITGDLAFEDEEGAFHFLGRADNELKIKGHRFMLEEVEYHLRRYSGCSLAAVVPLRSASGSIDVLIGYIVGESADAQTLKKELSQILPSALVPRRIEAVSEIPLCQNGKVDRKALEGLSRKGS